MTAPRTMDQHPIPSAPRRIASAFFGHALLITALLAPSSLVLAQTGGSGGSGGSGGEDSGEINVLVLRVAGENVGTDKDYYAGIEDCQRDGAIEVRLSGVSPDHENVDVWVGSSCNSTERTSEDSDCRLVANEEKGDRTEDIDISVPIAMLTDGCDTGSSNDETLWFLALDSSGSQEEVDQRYGTIEVRVDMDPPSAPTAVRGGSGENEIPVSWKIDDDDVERFVVYVDSGDGTGVSSDAGAGDGGSSSGECGTGKLEDADGDTVAGVKEIPVNSMTATGARLGPDDIDGDSAAVAVVAIDFAGNRSAFSSTDCVSVVPTFGYRDLYEMENGEIQQGCPCTAAGPAQAHTAWPIALAIGFIAYRGRRRRS